MLTLLAHSCPPERSGPRRVRPPVCDQWVPRARREARRSVDMWCDEGAFTLAETSRDPRRREVAWACRCAGMSVSSAISARPSCSPSTRRCGVDHLEQVSDAASSMLAKAGAVAVMLPGACVQLRLPVPPIEQLRAAGVPMAMATTQPGLELLRGAADPDVARDHALRNDRRGNVARRHAPRGARAAAFETRDAAGREGKPTS